MPWKMSLGSISGIYRCFSTSALETRRPSSLSTPDCQTGHVLKAPSPSLPVRSLLIHISAIIMSAPCSWPQLGTGLRPASSAQRNEKETLRAKGSQRAIFFVLCSCKRGRLSLREPMHPQRSLDVDAAHEVDVHVRVFVDAFFAGRPSEACWCEALDKKKKQKKKSLPSART